jgi:hypothetical protein
MRNSRIKKTIFLFCGLAFLVLSVSWAQEKLFKPYLESRSNGQVDWDNGYFYGVGLGSLKLNNNSQAQALRVAQAGALSAILQVAAQIRVDEQRTLLDLEQQQIIIRLQGLIEYEPFDQKTIQKNGEIYEQVTYRAPLRGVKGLTRQLLTYFRENVTPEQETPVPQTRAEAEESLPWLVLDARGLAPNRSPQPALFPKIITENNEIVSDVNTVDEQALVEQGLIHYVVSDKKPEEISLLRFRNLLAVFRKLWGPASAWAQGSNPPPKRGHYIIKNVQQTQGPDRTTLVISAADARALQSDPETNQALQKCRVIVVVSSSVGGVEGLLPEGLAQR